MDMQTYFWKILRYFLILFLTQNLLFSQEGIVETYIDSPINGKEVSFTEFLEALEQGNELVPEFEMGYVYVVKDVKVRFVQEIDRDGMDKRFFNGGPEIIIKANIRLSDVDFDPEFWLVTRGLTFQGYVWITATSALKAIFQECKFEKSLAFFSNEVDFIDFKGCEFRNGFRFVRGVITDHLLVDSCHFETSKIDRSDLIGNLGVDPCLFLIDNKIENLDLTVKDSQFILGDSLRLNPDYFLRLGSSVYANIRLLNCRLQTSLDLQNAAVGSNLEIKDTEINDYVFLSGLNANPLGSKIEWKDIAGKLAVIHPKEHALYHYGDRKKMPYHFFDELFGCYSTVYNIFKSQGNRYSTNQCYIEWKNVETEYLYQTYQKTDDLNIYFTYWMNVFMGYFCDYGTNPFRSLYLSGVVLLIFAGIYFFLPFQFGYRGQDFYSSMRLYLSYFKNHEELLNTLNERQNRPLERYESLLQYRKALKESKAPFYMYLLSLPDYLAWLSQKKGSRISFQMMQFLTNLRRSKGVKKIVASVLFFLLIVFFVFQNIFFRAFDCLAVSLNIFTTLGFGNTEIKGLPMYLIVLEGFSGWFLLSFFSLALFSQLIN